MAITYRILQQKSGGAHHATFIEDVVSQRKIGEAVFDTARGQFAFIPMDHDVVLSAADAASIVTILNGLSK